MLIIYFSTNKETDKMISSQSEATLKLPNSMRKNLEECKQRRIEEYKPAPFLSLKIGHKKSSISNSNGMRNIKPPLPSLDLDYKVQIRIVVYNDSYNNKKY